MMTKFKKMQNNETTITFWANPEEMKDPPYDVEVDINGGLFVVISSRNIADVTDLLTKIKEYEV